jgi:hypothetical protein
MNGNTPMAEEVKRDPTLKLGPLEEVRLKKK